METRRHGDGGQEGGKQSMGVWEYGSMGVWEYPNPQTPTPPRISCPVGFRYPCLPGRRLLGAQSRPAMSSKGANPRQAVQVFGTPGPLRSS
jgi:hypothetical protein